MCNVCWQVVTPASTAPARATDSSTTAGTLLASSVAQAAVQQPQVIGVRTLLEFVAWLVCSSGQAAAPGVQKGKPATQLGMNSRQGVMFLTEELSDVGIAVRRLQVSTAAHAFSAVSKPSKVVNAPARVVLCCVRHCALVNHLSLLLPWVYNLHVSHIHKAAQPNTCAPCPC